MTEAIRMHATGGPSVLQWEHVPTPEPAANEILLRHEAIGLNYIDVYFRTGVYKTQLPAIIGLEGAGVVLKAGAAVTDIRPGDRVAYCGGPPGGYATERVLPADRAVPLPDWMPAATAAAVMLQGITAHYLLHRTFVVRPGVTILVHAAAGGVGLFLCQWARHLGAHVIGVVSSAAKADIARAYGAAEVIVGYDDLPATVKRLTHGAMVPVVYDSIGRDTFEASLDCLAPLGLMVSFGNASGPVPPVDISQLAAKGSLFLTRPSLATYMAKTSELRSAAATLFEAVRSGAISVAVNQSFPLREAAAAHAALEARQTTGSTILVP